ncbi:N-6 DNA methylase [Brevibacterium sp. 1718]|uniref:N-6 DNA methylase n=1 Tax=Brevibacterium sp. 1718 TaxID=3413510 RepID=UPI003DA9E721
MGLSETERLIRSKRRVADHGEVFTPSWMVEDMLDLVKGETERIDSRILEPACGSGNFLIPVLTRKLLAVESRHGKSEFEKRHYALFALMCTYGIELLPDNAVECRGNLWALFNAYVGVDEADDWSRAACAVLEVNIVQGDALTMTTPYGSPIMFAEWGYLGKGKFQRSDFRYDELTRRSAWEAEGSLFQDFEGDLFAPAATHPTMTVRELAEQVAS